MPETKRYHTQSAGGTPAAEAPSPSALEIVLREVFPRSRSATRNALQMSATVRRFQTTDTILWQGDETPIALVLHGHAAGRRTTPDGRQLIVWLVGRGQLAAFLPLGARPAAADAVALTPTSVAFWRGPDVRMLAATDPGLAIDLLEHVLASLEGLVGRIDSLAYQDALRRVARVLHTNADLFFATAPVLTRSHLPTLVGTSREMTGRVLRLLESRSLVARVGRRGLRLLDPAGLEEAAELRR
jgi:CRP/FNR family transcriptional regulator